MEEQRRGFPSMPRYEPLPQVAQGRAQVRHSQGCALLRVNAMVYTKFMPTSVAANSTIASTGRHPHDIFLTSRRSSDGLLLRNRPRSLYDMRSDVRNKIGSVCFGDNLVKQGAEGCPFFPYFQTR